MANENCCGSEISSPDIPDLYEIIFRQASIGVEVYDCKGSLLDANAACLEIFGVSDFSCVEKFRLFEDQSLSEENKKRLQAGKPVSYNHTFCFDTVREKNFYSTSKTGRIELSIRIDPIRNEQGIIGFIALINDITEQLEEQRIRAESEQLFRNAFEHHGVAKLIIDPESGEIVHANSAAVKYYGWKKEQLLSMRIHDINMMSENGVQQKIEHTRISEECHFEFKHRLASGVIRDVEVFSSKIEVGGRQLLHSIIHDITDKKEVQEKKRMLADMVDFAPESITVHDESGTFLFANQKTFSMHGFSKEEFMGISLRDLRLPESDERYYRRVQLLEQKGDILFEIEHYRKDGSTFPLEVHAKKIDWEGIPAVLSVATDITERKEAESALRESENNLKRAQSIAHFGSWCFDLDKGTVIASEETRMLYGIEKYPITIKEVQTIPLPQYRGLLDKKMKQLIEGEGDYSVEFQIRRPSDNAVRCIHSVAEYDSAKNLVIGTIQDITERKVAEDAVEAEKERLSVTLRSIGDGVITTDRNGRVVLVNTVAEELTGWTQSEAQGKPLDTVFSIIHEFTRQPCEDPVKKVLSTGEVIELANHTCLVARDGTERVIADSGAPIKDKDDEIIGVVLVFRDMTEKQKLLGTIQRTAKLDSIGVLAGGIAHDFNNLLSGIFGYVDMASECTEDERVSRCLEKVLGTLGRARGLTQQLLTFSKGGEPVKKVNALFPFVQETAQFALSGSSVTFKSDVPVDLWKCSYDRNQIGQVIDNIVINAKQATPDGGMVEISAENIVVGKAKGNYLLPGRYVRLSFRDQGVGMPKEILNRIFDPFYTTKAKGHGLGLATCYSIINKHGGHIEVESEPGNGSTFYVFLPASDESASPLPPKKPVELSGKGTILVMDDEEVLLDLTSDILESFGYSVLTATNGNRALDLFVEASRTGRELTAMILDLTIPGALGGKETIAEIRKHDEDIPVFVASGYADDPIMAEPKAYGFTASISKPFRKAELARMLGEFLETEL
ncbi:MAG: PAS domain S-box protein [Chitinispirillaceae bacterium]